MEKKYQVFISSTYEDLKDERLGVIASLLTANCIPVGMEQFTASGLSQWEYIKTMIDMSDYYILILAGRYGSVELESGLGYTEKEFDYAVNKNIPILAFLYSDINKLPVEKRDSDHALWERIDKFREKAKSSGYTVDHYSSVDELKYKVNAAINNAIKWTPAIGLVRADSISDDTDKKNEINDLNEQIAAIKKQVNSMPRIKIGHEEPTNLNNGDIYLQYE